MVKMLSNSRLEINGQSTPINVDLNEAISVTWKAAKQTSYRLEVFDEKEQCIFDFEEVSRRQSQSIVLPRHFARKKYSVKLSVYNSNQKIVQETMNFYTQNHDLNLANWITRLDNPIEKEHVYFDDKPTIILKKQVVVKETIESAFIDICGLGYYTLRINGQRVSDAYLNSDVTSYDQRVYYDTYQIESFLTEGTNEFTVELANGWYNPAPILILGKYNIRKQLSIGKPTMICDIQLTTTNQSIHILSDAEWESSCGQFLQNNLFVGEVFTDNVQPADNVRKQTVCIPGPTGKLVPSFIPKIVRKEKILPVSFDRLADGWIIDFGQIISGQIAFDLAAETIGCIELSYAEVTDDKGNPAYGTTISGKYGVKTSDREPESPVIQTDKVMKEKLTPLHFSNQYTYHSFRYVFVKGTSEFTKLPLENVIAYRLFSDVELLVDFDSSSEDLNQLWQAGINTRQNNMHAYFEDCTRERFGYGGDIVALLSSHIATSDIKEFAKKVFLDFVDAQIADGGIPQTAPFIGIMTNGTSNKAGSLGWQLVLPTLAKALSTTYQEADFVKQYQAQLEKHLQYLLCFDFSMIRSCCLGDWGSVDGKEEGWVISSPDQSFCSGCMYVILLNEYLELMDEGICSTSHLDGVKEKIAIAKSELLKEFNRETGNFSSGKISSDIFAIQAGLISGEDRDKRIRHLIKKIRENGTIFSFGIFGMSWAYELFSEIGENRLIYDWLLRQEGPSYQDMLKNGNLALAEYFSVPGQQKTQPGSLNHAMFSSYSSWFVSSLLGLRIENKQLIIDPAVDLPIDWVSGSLKTPMGKVTINWKKENQQQTKIVVEIPNELAYIEKVSQKHRSSKLHLKEKDEYKIITFEIKN
ncbi:family 78 glycoside hydrolase catalytic domain [Candidatus Enterococcus clewellii]|uniref:family 78 glycoside hydrolase catalytic domain n=1 Tax=Candidatus Enterococcus clewellii TaxID=1834193 RepID=UPI0020160D04|nr:family 78 glycoside hydrolase catalytic domain [Enterococcus sp. 9E7_DIV0242]